MRYSIFLLLCMVILGFSTPVNAQLSDLTESSIDVSLIPANPKDNEVVQASIMSYLTDLDGANIVWEVDGKIQKSGIGVKIINFTVGNIGEKTNLKILINTKEGDRVTKTMTIVPSSVDLMWQSDSYVPPFYKGKAMFGHQDNITFIAIPHISSNSEMNPQNYIYNWTQNGKAVQDSSGYGKNTLTVTGSIISRPLKIEVEVSSPSSYTTAYGYTTVKPVDPFILFYKKDPRYGIEFQKTLNNHDINLSTPEITVTAVPMFFGIDKTTSQDVSYTWQINGLTINNTEGTDSQIFRKAEGVSGTSNISLKIEHQDKILQFTSGSFKLSFGNQTQ